MPGESNTWNSVRDSLKGTGRQTDLTRVENSAHPGTPDVNFSLDCVDGWVELKYLQAWPARESTIVKIEHFSPQQRVWLTRRCRLGGNAKVLLRVGRDYHLFHGDDAAKYLGRTTKSELLKWAFWGCVGKLDGRGLREALKS